ncbi:MAG TPA: flagellar export chaperone FliS [Syntrophomonas sp.]|nr:flagellar export chaperone FliS [Syntrophomonas sp.]
MNAQLFAYKKNQINTASSEDLVLMLYDGAIKFIKKAVLAVNNQNYEEANENFKRAQKIVAGLVSGLNYDAGEIAQNLYSLYEYMHHQLVRANMKKDVQAAEEVLTMIEELRTVWVQAVKSPNEKSKENFTEKKTALG